MREAGKVATRRECALCDLCGNQLIPPPYARIQRIEQIVKPALSRFTRRHLQQNLARGRGGVFDGPPRRAIADSWIANSGNW